MFWKSFLFLFLLAVCLNSSFGLQRRHYDLPGDEEVLKRREQLTYSAENLEEEVRALYDSCLSWADGVIAVFADAEMQESDILLEVDENSVQTLKALRKELRSHESDSSESGSYHEKMQYYYSEVVDLFSHLDDNGDDEKNTVNFKQFHQTFQDIINHTFENSQTFVPHRTLSYWEKWFGVSPSTLNRISFGIEVFVAGAACGFVAAFFFRRFAEWALPLSLYRPTTSGQKQTQKQTQKHYSSPSPATVGRFLLSKFLILLAGFYVVGVFVNIHRQLSYIANKQHESELTRSACVPQEGLLGYIDTWWVSANEYWDPLYKSPCDQQHMLRTPVWAQLNVFEAATLGCTAEGVGAALGSFFTGLVRHIPYRYEPVLLVVLVLTAVALSFRLARFRRLSLPFISLSFGSSQASPPLPARPLPPPVSFSHTQANYAQQSHFLPYNYHYPFFLPPTAPHLLPLPLDPYSAKTPAGVRYYPHAQVKQEHTFAPLAPQHLAGGEVYGSRSVDRWMERVRELDKRHAVKEEEQEPFPCPNGYDDRTWKRNRMSGGDNLPSNDSLAHLRFSASHPQPDNPYASPSPLPSPRSVDTPPKASSFSRMLSRWFKRTSDEDQASFVPIPQLSPQLNSLDLTPSKPHAKEGAAAPSQRDWGHVSPPHSPRTSSVWGRYSSVGQDDDDDPMRVYLRHAISMGVKGEGEGEGEVSTANTDSPFLTGSLLLHYTVECLAPDTLFPVFVELLAPILQTANPQTLSQGEIQAALAITARFTDVFSGEIMPFLPSFIPLIVVASESSSLRLRKLALRCTDALAANCQPDILAHGSELLAVIVRAIGGAHPPPTPPPIS
eukprot:GCRY01000893.1.p1 GENE.GCRY01000893.1~~GCRY01000893.1.p1  ORF type:complete len:839 (+),score=247.66 GCRY01000893.1:150-2666(+)